VLKKEYGCI
jgi:hypothetical protein